MDNKKSLFYGWWIAAATFVILFIGLCSGFYTVSVFLEPIQRDLCTIPILKGSVSVPIIGDMII
jgi:hypothetical protein